MNLGTDLKTVFTKINSMVPKHFIVNLKCKSKVLEDNIGENLDDLRYASNFLDKTTKAWSLKEIIGKLDFIKLKISTL